METNDAIKELARQSTIIHPTHTWKEDRYIQSSHIQPLIVIISQSSIVTINRFVGARSWPSIADVKWIGTKKSSSGQIELYTYIYISSWWGYNLYISIALASVCVCVCVCVYFYRPQTPRRVLLDAAEGHIIPHCSVVYVTRHSNRNRTLQLSRAGCI